MKYATNFVSVNGMIGRGAYETFDLGGPTVGGRRSPSITICKTAIYSDKQAK